MASISLLFSVRYETIGGILYRYSSSQDAEISNNVGYWDPGLKRQVLLGFVACTLRLQESEQKQARPCPAV
jgi:hypothetical protein